jgi:hypothetical protein
MNRSRFSFTAMFGLVAIVALGCAALWKPTGLWVMVISATTVTSLFFATLAAIYQQQARRAFWVGFAVVGWGFFGVQQLPGSSALPMNRISEKLLQLVHPEQVPPNLNPHVPNPVARPVANADVTRSFAEIVNWLWPLVFGFIGGLFARHLYLRQ